MGAEWVCGRFQFDLSETQIRMWFYAGSVCGRFPRFERQRRRLRKIELRKLPKLSFSFPRLDGRPNEGSTGEAEAQHLIEVACAWDTPGAPHGAAES